MQDTIAVAGDLKGFLILPICSSEIQALIDHPPQWIDFERN